jgi:hypothetical protein
MVRVTTGFAAGAVLVLLASCAAQPSITAVSPAPVSSSAGPSSSTASPDASQAAGPAVGSGSPTGFVGRWHVHGATLDIAASSATMVVSLGPCDPPGGGMCAETDALTVTPSGDGNLLTLVVTAVTYANATGPVANPEAGPSTAVGDSMQLVLQAPGLLKRTALQGFPGMDGGNPYWCGPDISPANAGLCGA